MLKPPTFPHIIYVDDDEHQEELKQKEVETSSDEPTILSQYEFKENPNAKLYKLGFTVEVIQQLIA